VRVYKTERERARVHTKQSDRDIVSMCVRVRVYLHLWRVRLCV